VPEPLSRLAGLDVCTGVTSTRTASRSIVGCAVTCRTLAPYSWTGPLCWVAGNTEPRSPPRPPRDLDRLDRAESALTPASSRTPTLRRSAWSRSTSASSPSRRRRRGGDGYAWYLWPEV